MSAIDEAVKADERFAQTFQTFALGRLPATPARKLAVVACMDCRLTVEQILGLRTGDAHIIRNAGGLVTDDALRSLIISYHKLGTREFMIIQHTECGMLGFRDEDLRAQLQEETGVDVPLRFLAFNDLTESVLRQIQILRTHPWIPDDVRVRGFIYDVRTGHLREVFAPPEAPDDAGGLPALSPLPPLTSLSE